MIADDAELPDVSIADVDRSVQTAIHEICRQIGGHS